MVKLGIYEQVINNDLAAAIAVEPGLRSFTRPIDKAEAPKVLSRYLASILEKELSSDKFEEDLDEQVRLVNEILNVIGKTTGESIIDDWLCCKSQLKNFEP
jgi:hypothetical protein